jgi:hypothetical protein
MEMTLPPLALLPYNLGKWHQQRKLSTEKPIQMFVSSQKLLYTNRLCIIFLQRRSKAKRLCDILLQDNTQNPASLGKKWPYSQKMQKVMFSFLCHLEEV